MKKIAFFDIDGTLTSEIDGSIPESAVYAIRAARANGNLMFINTGRCFQNVEQRFRDVGFDGFVCGCEKQLHYGLVRLCDMKDFGTRMPDGSMRRLKNAAMRCRSTLRILIFSVISLSYGLSTPSSLPVSVPQATAILSALTGAAISANSFRSATPKPPVLTMCLIIPG